jgi:metal-sulfur cluster biosynthetic enzyme
MNSQVLYKDVVDCCKTIQDPEIPQNIWDLGLVYSIEVEKRTKIDGDARDVLDEGKPINESGETFMNAEITMTLTTPSCPVGPEFLNNVKTRVQEIEGIDRCNVDLVWDPPWDQSMMSEEAQLMLGMELNRPMLDRESDDEGKHWE